MIMGLPETALLVSGRVVQNFRGLFLSMTEQDYISAFRDRWPMGMPGSTSMETLTLADEAVLKFPASSRLWQLRGDLIHLGDGKSAHSLEEALHCYETALKLDPDYAEAHESIGYYLDVIDENFPCAEAAFLKATQFGGGEKSWAGLARVLAEQRGPVGEILGMLNNCPFADSPCVREVRKQLEDGYWHSGK